MKRILQIWASALMLAAPAMAQDMPVVVELFTSQGCSSCPPADALLHDLAGRDDVIALALHVDYWDYIGWKDEFADPGHAQRQRAYAAAAGRRSIYTPEMIVQGVSDIVGAKPMQLNKAIMAHARAAPGAELTLRRDGDRIAIKALPKGARGAMQVHLLRYQPARQSAITRGENAGKTIDYANVTEDWRVVAQWDGRAPLALEVAAPGDLPVVVLIQREGPGEIIAAARLR